MTEQGTLVSVFFGYSRVIAGIAGGFIFDSLGATDLFIIGTLMMACCLIFFLISHKNVQKISIVNDDAKNINQVLLVSESGNDEVNDDKEEFEKEDTKSLL